MAVRGINKVILVGRLGKDPEVRYIPNGGAVANLQVATSESWRDKQTGEMREQTEWHRVVLFGKLAEVAGEYLRKGAQVYIEGQLTALLPEGWSRDMTTFLSLSQEVLLSLLSFCTACSLNGVQTRECGHTSRSPLDTLESAIGFHMRDWWQPTKANFFGHLKKPQIIAALNDAGLSGAARDAEKMKKGDAAEHAEFHMKDNRWVPGWMCSPRPQTDATERADNLADAA